MRPFSPVFFPALSCPLGRNCGIISPLLRFWVTQGVNSTGFAEEQRNIQANMVKGCFWMVLMTVLLVLPLPAVAGKRPLLALDSGHTPQQRGVLGARGMYEVDYNDRFVAELKPQLEAIGWDVILTRQPEESLALAERAARANRLRADLFLSIHHDSTQPAFVYSTTVNGVEAKRTVEPFSGYSLFVSQLNPRYTESRRFATLLARQIRSLGRAPTLHHADPIRGESRPLLDSYYGIYRFDRLVVLRKAKMPAVLLEVGVLPDPEDEAWTNNPRNRQAMEAAVVRAVQLWGGSGVRP